MKPFALTVVTPDGQAFEGMAEEVIVRTTSGDIGILADHADCVAPLGMGRATIVTGGEKRYASCIGGIIFVLGGEVKLVPTTFEWAEDIDVERAERAQQKAQSRLSKDDASDTDIRLAQAKLHRALVRKSVASYK